MTRLIFLLGSCLMLYTVEADVQGDFKYLMSIFEGLYDNIDQYKADIQHALPPAYRHLHLATSVVAEQVPVLPGRTSFYLEQYLNGSNDNLIRQRIYSFAIDSMKRINLKLYSLVDQAKFAHAPRDSPLFKQLRAQDIVYAQGCDVYWERVSSDLFRTNMFNTCIVPIAGSQVLIIDKTTLSPSYLTADETWIFVKNGTVLKVYPGPYNMTRQKTLHSHMYMTGQKTALKPLLHLAPAAPNRAAPPRAALPKAALPRAGPAELTGFQALVSALVAGQPVRYYMKTSQCQYETGDVPGAQAHVGGFIDAFEYFRDPQFGPEHFGFSTFLLSRNTTGKLVVDLREGLVYKDGHVQLRRTTLTPDYQLVLDIQNITCKLSTAQASGSALFYSGGASITQLSDFPSIVKALETGSQVRFSVNYALCDLAVGAIGGGKIDDFEIWPDGSMVRSSQYKIITNYQGPGYVSDIVIGSFYQNSSAIFIASDVIVDTDKAFYTEQIDCEINGLRPGGAVYLYKIE